MSEAVEPGAHVVDGLETARVQVIQPFLDQGVKPGQATGVVGIGPVQGRFARDFAGGHGVEARTEWGFLKAGAWVLLGTGP